MTPSTRTALFWAPRLLTLLFAVFISLFALDVFTEGLGVWQTVAHLLIHLIPTALVLVLLAVAWRQDWVGAVAYGVLGTLYIVQAWGRFPLVTYVTVAGPLYVIGGLFLLNWLSRTKPIAAA